MLARWQHLVAFMKALDLLHQAMCLVLYRRIAMAIETASKLGTFCIVVLLIVALAAAGAIRSEDVALDKLHWAMPHVLLQRLRMAIEMA